MAKFLVIHGAGMNMRGKAQIEVFGPMTLPEYDAQIRTYAAQLSVELDIFHSNSEGAVVDRIYGAHGTGLGGCIINPAGFSVGYSALNSAITQVDFPTVEVHISNPAVRGRISDVGRHTKAVITGFGIFGYSLAMQGLIELGRRK
jgi:3-dehydroquinate dehydratase II